MPPVISIIQALIGVAGQLPSLVAAGKVAIALVREGRDPTSEEQAIIDAGLDEADKALPTE